MSRIVASSKHEQRDDEHRTNIGRAYGEHRTSIQGTSKHVKESLENKKDHITKRDKRLESKARAYRNTQIQDLLIQGYTQSGISRKLGISEPTVSRALKSLKNQARQNQQLFIEQEIPLRHKTALERVSSLIQELYELKEKSTNKKEVIQTIAQLTQLEISLLGDPQAISNALKAVARIRRGL